MKNPGLINKYLIAKTDGSPVDPGAEYFVLRLDEGCEPNHRNACRSAIAAYARAIEPHIPELARDLSERYLQ